MAHRVAKRLLGVVLSVTTIVASAAQVPVPILSDSLQWIKAPGFSGLAIAWALGGEKTPGPYVLRVKLDPGTRVIAHTHPDARHTTVLEGTLYVGFGESFDEASLVPVPTGSLYVAPAGVAHFLWAKDGAVLYQESGVGPTATAPIKPH